MRYLPILLLLFAWGCRAPLPPPVETIPLSNPLEANLVRGTELDLIYRPEFIRDYISKLKGNFTLDQTSTPMPELFLKAKFVLVNGELQFSRWGVGSVIAKSYSLWHNTKPYLCTATVTARSIQIARKQRYYAQFEIMAGGPQITAIYTYGVKVRIIKTENGGDALEIYETDLPLKVFNINASDYIDKQFDYNPQPGIDGWWNQESDH